MTDLDEILGPPALEKTRRYKRLAKALLSCARWERTERNPECVTSFEAALKAVITATSALPADGSLGRKEHEERLMELVMLRDTIHSVMAEARHEFG
ncbi:hypothetical protein ACFVU3_19395 [Streptomyces sp. NPDC058052]|uniref:hypothetical protein n=1 Tax=Streptomyces sp. NPDC058052 TaxID=3346316 RepID=UPI0036E8170F